MRALVSHTLIAITLLGSALGSPMLRAQAPQPAAQPFRPADQLPFDAAVRKGTLPNGFTYYVRANGRPAARLSLRLAVKAGSLHEADDQQGLAHFLEHMAFNGSASFKPGELISYFESTGARLGPHVNAYTSFDETVYRLELPTDVPEIVARGFSAMADFAGGLTLDPGQVEKERGVVIEEWRGRLGAGSRVRDKQLPLLYYRSRYADRLPIGKPEVLRSAPAARLRAFYDAWYRPERMAIIAVGDIDPAQVETTIRSVFGKLVARAPGLDEPDDSVPLHDELLVSSIADPEVTSSMVQVVSKQRAAADTTVGDYRRSIVDRLFERMLNERFDELSRKPDAAFLAAGGGGGSLNEEVDTFSLSARVPDGGIPKGLAAIALEARRARELGFTAPELDRAKRALLASYERAYNERDKSESGSFAQEYLNHFLVQEPSPGIQYEYQLLQSVLPGVTLEEIGARAKLRLADESRVVLAVAPEKKELTQTSETELRSAFDSASKLALMPWAVSDPTRPLMGTPPDATQVVSKREIPEIGVTVVRFGNGVEAWLKPTDFKNDQVLFTMYALGGASLADPEDFLEASFATSFIGLSGIGGFSDVELNRMLAGKRASASSFISLSTHGVSGSAAPTELETALQLLYLNVTAPGDSDEAFALMRRQLDAMVANRGQDPNEVFSERLAQVNASDHYTARPLTPEDVATLDRAKMTSYYRQRFSNAADFTFFMVGAFNVDTVAPLLARYVGGLPSTGEKTSTFKQLGVKFPSDNERARVEKGREPRSHTVLSFYADPEPDPMQQERTIAATTVLQTALRDILREELGQTYTVSVGQSQSLPQRGGGHIQVSFGAAPENIESMAGRVVAEIKRLQQEGPTEAQTASARESARRGYETSLKQNAYWLGRLQTVHMLGRDPLEITTRLDRIKAITPESLRETYRTLFPLNRYTVVTLVPASQ
jgi:zinc protease